MKPNPCPLCGGRLAAKSVPYDFAGVNLGTFQAEICGKCGEVFFTEEASRRIDKTAKEKGVWGIGRRAKVGYSGHSLILRIPAELAAAAHLKKGSTVYLQPAGERKILVEAEYD